MTNGLSRHQSVRRSIGAVFLLLVVLIIGVPAQGGIIDYVTNGSFESLITGNSLGAAGGYFCKTGSGCTSNATGWTSNCRNSSCGTGATPDSLLINGHNGSAFNGGLGLYTGPDTPDGSNYIAFDGDSTYNAYVSQTISGLVVGQTYTLTFDQAAAQQKGTTGPTTEQWQISFGANQYLSTLMNNASQGFVPWMKQTITITADSTSDTLKFLSLGTPGGEPPVVLLDGVSLVDAPEPQTFALIGIGFLAVSILTRRRRRGDTAE
jgi:hypothetical protein